MKKTIFWRALLTIVVLAAWASLLFPLKDKEYIPTFRDRVTITDEVLDKRLETEIRKGVIDELKAEFAKNSKPPKADFDQLPDEQKNDFYSTGLLSIESKVKKAMADLDDATKAKRIADIKAEMLKDLDALLKEVEAQWAANQEAVKTSELLREDDPKVPLVSTKSYESIITDLARGDSGTKGFDEFMVLGDYVDMTSKSNPENSDVVFYIRNCTRSRIRLGLDLAGGTEFVIAFDEADVDKFNAENDLSYTAKQCRDMVIETLRNRVDPHGVKEVEIRPNTDTSISIRTPITDEAEIQRMRSMLDRVGNLQFYIVHDENDKLIEQGMEPGAGYKKLPLKDRNSKNAFIWVTEAPAKVTGKDVANAGPAQNEVGLWYVSMSFKQGGAVEMGKLTGGNIGKRMAIVLDGVVFSAPTIQGQINSSGQITGDFTQEEASKLSVILKSGSLPVQTRVDSMMTTDPTLGDEFVKSGTYACIYGMIGVIIFMLVYYRLGGLIAITALTANILLIIGSLPLVHAALTLPGIAGIVLTIGMAVDANVLIFERIREESIKGKSIATAVKNGYSRAFWTILDANLTTLFTAFFLYKFGSGTIKGFAVTLTLGILASMFTALFVTRWIFDLLIQLDILKKASLIHCKINKKYTEKNMFPDLPFVNLRKVAGIVSAVLFIAAIGIFSAKKGGLSSDFRGGTQVLMQCDTQPKINEVATLLQDEGFVNPKLTYKKGLATSMLEVVLETQEYSFKMDAKNLTSLSENEIGAVLVNAGAVNPKSIINKATSTVSITVGGKSVSDDITLEGLFKALAAEPAFAEAEFSNFQPIQDGKLTNFADLQRLLNDKFEKANFSKPVIKNVGSLISGEFGKKAILSIIFALIVIILYISFRFEFGYGIGAVAALVHDVVICTGVYLAFDRQISLTVIAALLTIIGYSLNDTIVVFDRIRENIEFYGKKKKSFLELVNMSLNQTLSRTILTSLTTLLVVVSLLLFGGGAIDDFALIMIFGVLVGTYSSLFIATPVMIIVQSKLAEKEGTETAEKKPATNAA